MFNPKLLIAISLTVLLVGSQQVGVAPCPLQYQIGSIHSSIFYFIKLESHSLRKGVSYHTLKVKMSNAIIIHSLIPLQMCHKQPLVPQL